MQPGHRSSKFLGIAGDGRFLINAQAGELEVVSPEPGTWPEKTRLTLEDGEVVEIDRVRGSSELPEGEVRAGLAQDEVSCELAGAPRRAQRRRVGTDGQQGVAEGPTLGTGVARHVGDGVT